MVWYGMVRCLISIHTHLWVWTVVLCIYWIYWFYSTMHILEDFSRTDNSLYKCHKKYFQLVKKIWREKMRGKHKNAKNTQKMGIFSKYFFENQLKCVHKIPILENMLKMFPNLIFLFFPFLNSDRNFLHDINFFLIIVFYHYFSPFENVY